MEHRPPAIGAQTTELPKIDPEALYLDGELARLFGKSLESVRRFRKKHNIAGRFGRTPLTKGADIIRALEGGSTLPVRERQLSPRRAG